MISMYFFSCNKSNDELGTQQPTKDSVAEILSYSINEMNAQITISPLSVNIQFPDTVYDPKNLTASFTLSPGATATIKGTAQVSNTTKNNYNSYLNYSVQNKSGFVKNWIVSSTNNSYTYNMGLGNFLKQSHSNDCSYNWYFTQAGTGQYWYINCGPTCVTMAMKWADSTFNLLPVDARNYFPTNTGYWGFGTVGEYLNEHNFKCSYVQLGNTAEETLDIIKHQLDSGRVAILALTTESIRSYIGTSSDPYADNYYYDHFNHFILAYGYKEVDGEFFFQVNDPWNVSSTHHDGSLKGKNRHYRYEDIFKGCMNVENGICVIYKKQ